MFSPKSMSNLERLTVYDTIIKTIRVDSVEQTTQTTHTELFYLSSKNYSLYRNQSFAVL
jgi:hypothetical protein